MAPAPSTRAGSCGKCYHQAMGAIKASQRPALVVRKGRPDIRQARAVLGRIRSMRPESNLTGKTVEEIVRMTKRTREQIWKERLALRS